MKRKEVPLINVVMITHPFKKIPLDICPREEIASPSKLLAVAQTRDLDWDETTIYGHTFQRCWLQSRYRYPSISHKLSSVGFYCCAQDPAMFLSLLEVPDTMNGIHEWLKTYGKTMAVVTTPLMCYRTKYQEIFYYLSNTSPQRTIVISPITDIMHQMLNNNAYTICNGVTLAIAMHRLGFWSQSSLENALWVWGAEESTLYSEITPETQPLIVQHLIPQVCDHPYFYACMGKMKAHISVVRCLHDLFQVYEPFVQQHDAETQIVTNAVLQMLPYIPMHLFDYATKSKLDDEDADVDIEHMYADVGGLMQALFTQKGIWKRWNEAYEETITRFQGTMSDEAFIDHCLRRSFLLYNKGCHAGRVCTSRVRRFWQQLISVLDPTHKLILRWVHKYVFLCHISQELAKKNVHTGTWLPKIPMAFLVELVHICGDQWNIYDHLPITFMTVHREVDGIFRDAVLTTRFSDDERYTIAYTIHRSFMSFASKMNRNSAFYAFYKLVRNRVQSRLLSLRTAFMRPTIPRLNDNDGYTIWTILDDFFNTNKSKLML